jgi:hypothetical protein
VKQEQRTKINTENRNEEEEQHNRNNTEWWRRRTYRNRTKNTKTKKQPGRRRNKKQKRGGAEWRSPRTTVLNYYIVSVGDFELWRGWRLLLGFKPKINWWVISDMFTSKVSISNFQGVNTFLLL